MTMLLPIILLALAPAAPTEDEAPAGPPALVSARTGRVTLVQGEVSTPLPRSAEPVEVLGAAILELGAGARAEVRWSGMMSLQLLGPARVEWKPASEEGAAPALEVESLRRLEWEVRAGAPELVLSQGWRLSASRGAWRLEAASGGSVDVTSHGGEDLRVSTEVRRRAGSWPARIKPGNAVRLRPPPG